MAMYKRSVLNHIIRIASALALLMAMTSSPLRPFHSGPSSSRPESSRSDWASRSGRCILPHATAANINLDSAGFSKGHSHRKRGRRPQRRVPAGTLLLRFSPASLRHCCGEFGDLQHCAFAPSAPVLSDCN